MYKAYFVQEFYSGRMLGLIRTQHRPKVGTLFEYAGRTWAVKSVTRGDRPGIRVERTRER